MTDTAAATTDAPARPAQHRRDPARDAAILGLLGTLIVVATAPVRAQAAPTWRLTLPLLPSPGGPLYSVFSFAIGMSLLGLGWFRLGTYAARTRVEARRRLRVVSLIVTLWAVPLLLGPPLLSNDVYSYAAQGEAASRGYDVTRVGPIALGGGKFLRAADEIWHFNPSPYGPVWNKLASTVVIVTGHDAARAVWGFRVVIALSVAVSAWAVSRLARAVRVDPAMAVALGIGNPLMLVHVLGGIHNDALMLALLLVGLYLARREHRWLALLLITAAAAVKLPAAAGLVYLGWNWREELDTRLKHLFGAVVAGAIGMLLIIWLSIEVRMGMGWLGALRGTSKVMTTYAPVTMSGMVVSEFLHLLGINISSGSLVGMFRGIGLLGAGALAWTLLYNCRRIGEELALGLTLLIVVVLGPVMWPWYLPPAIAMLAVSGAERYRPALTVSSIAVSLFVFPTSAGTHLGLSRYHSLIGMALIIGITLLAMGAQWFAREPVLPQFMLERVSRFRRATKVVVPA